MPAPAASLHRKKDEQTRQRVKARKENAVAERAAKLEVRREARAAEALRRSRWLEAARKSHRCD